MPFKYCKENFIKNIKIKYNKNIEFWNDIKLFNFLMLLITFDIKYKCNQYQFVDILIKNQLLLYFYW